MAQYYCSLTSANAVEARPISANGSKIIGPGVNQSKERANQRSRTVFNAAADHLIWCYMFVSSAVENGLEKCDERRTLLHLEANV